MEPAEYWDIVIRYHGYTARLLAKRFPLQPLATCEDCVSEAMIQLLHVLPKLTPDNTSAYLFQASRSKMRDHLLFLRREAPRIAEWAATYSRPTRSSEQAILARQALDYYLSNLLPKARKRLLGAVIHGNDEMAEMLGRTRGAIGAGLWKSRRKLLTLRKADEETARAHKPLENE